MVSVLIVEAFGVVRRGLQQIVEQWLGWGVAAKTGNGREAVALALQHDPDIAIIDYSPPMIDAVEITRQLRKRQPRIEILIYAAGVSDAVLRELLHAGARGVALKSDPEQLLASALAAIARRKPFFSDRISPDKLAALASLRKERSGLTPRETAVARLIAQGYSQAQITELLQLDADTVRTIQASALGKLGLAAPPERLTIDTGKG